MFPRPRRVCDPAELAQALRLIHDAGLRRSFVALAPAAPPDSSRDGVSWGGLCRDVCKQTPLGVVALGDGGTEVLEDAPQRVFKRATWIGGAARGLRAAVLELSRGVCTADPLLATEARALGTPVLDPVEAAAAGSDGALAAFLADLLPESLRRAGPLGDPGERRGRRTYGRFAASPAAP